MVRSDIDAAIKILEALSPASPTYDCGLIRFRLQCRRFVELVLDGYEAKLRKYEEVGEGCFLLDLPMPSASRVIHSEGGEHMQRILDYGSRLSNNWKEDKRPFVRELLRRTVVYEDPYSNIGTRELVSPEARLELASEANKAVLGKSSLI